MTFSLQTRPAAGGVTRKQVFCIQTALPDFILKF